MIIFFGPAGAGKSVQGQILAARHNWRWLSTGQLLRDTHDPELMKHMATGGLIDDAVVNEAMHQAFGRSEDIDQLILDGFPRELSQAKWLVDILPHHKRDIKLVVVLEVPQSEIERRLHIRGRIDDSPEVIAERLRIFREKIYPILDYLNGQKVRIAHIDGTGTVGQVHDRIEEELAACSLV